MINHILKYLCKKFEYVKIFVNYLVQNMESHDSLETSKIEQTAIPIPVPPIRVEVYGGVIDLGTP